MGGKKIAVVWAWQTYPDIFRSYSAGCGTTPAREHIEPCFAKELEMAVQTTTRTEER